jgi:hypothetical protein
MVGGMVVILFGVALVRASGPRSPQAVVPPAAGTKKRKRRARAIVTE